MNLKKEDTQEDTQKPVKGPCVSMDEEFLLEGIVDTLMERYADIGTNIKEEYPRTHKVGNKIYLCDRNGKARFVLTLTKGQ